MWTLQFREAGPAGDALMVARKSEEQKRMEGTQRPDRALPEPPRSAVGTQAPSPPRWLDRYGKAKWREMVPDLESRQLLTGASLDLLETLCSAYGDYRRYEKASRPGASYETESRETGSVLHRRRPEAGLAMQARKEYTALARELRLMISAAPPLTRIDPMNDFLDGGRRGRSSASR
jgi:P27 family predicted phage terminase small subunit